MNRSVALEDLYQAAGWHAALLTMAEYGRSLEEQPRAQMKSFGKFTLDLCKLAYTRPHEFVPRIDDTVTQKKSDAIREYSVAFINPHTREN